LSHPGSEGKRSYFFFAFLAAAFFATGFLAFALAAMFVSPPFKGKKGYACFSLNCCDKPSDVNRNLPDVLTYRREPDRR
jgi:hypothetical protein